MGKTYYDALTGLNNEEYLQQRYKSYLKDHKNSNFVMIDLSDFKGINDNFGHDVGDDCLKVFSDILRKIFSDSLLIRLHGDEFAILTDYSESELEKIFVICDKEIINAVEQRKIPVVFEYNLGCSSAEEVLSETRIKADYMMYYAKKNKNKLQMFSNSIWQEKIKQDSFLRDMEEYMKSDSFSYTKRQFYDKDKNPKKIFQIYTKLINGNPLFNNNNYNVLRYNSKIPSFDMYNIQRIMKNIQELEETIVITIDYKSLVMINDLFEYLVFSKYNNKIKLNNIILNIDLEGLQTGNYKKIINDINNLKLYGFKIRLDKIDSSIGDIIWEQTTIDFIKIAYSYWKKAMNNSKLSYSLSTKINMYSKYDNTIIVFDYIETEEEDSFLKKISPPNTLFSGNYYSEENDLF